jgi:hypothetical protein
MSAPRRSKRFQPNAITEKIVPVILILLLIALLAVLVITILPMAS